MIQGFVVCVPDFTTRSVGVRCLFDLAEDLRRKGFASFLCGCKEGAPGSRVPVISLDLAQELCRRGCAAVYSETVKGNPFSASHVVRWVLNSPGLLGGDPVFEASELVFIYSEVYRSYVKNEICGVLYRPAIDRTLFNSDAVDEHARILTCFYVGKSCWKDGIISRDDAFEITREEPARSELGKLLRHTRVLYCFDNSTMLIYEALLCGCSVVVIPDGTHTRADYERLELGCDGICWWPDESALSGSVPGQILSRLSQFEASYEQQLQSLICSVGFDAASQEALAAFTAVSEMLERRSRWHARIKFASGVRGIRNELRRFERGFRRLRKSFGLLIFAPSDEQWDIDECPASTVPGNREIEIYAMGACNWLPDGFDVSRVIGIPNRPRTAPKNIAYLMRRARRFISFDASVKLEELAEKVGCPIVRVSKIEMRAVSSLGVSAVGKAERARGS